MSSVCFREYEAIYLQTSSFNPRKDGFLRENGSPVPLPNDLLSASKLMERKIMFFTSCWKCVGFFEACRHFVGDVGTGKIPKAGRDLTGVRGPPGQVWLTIPSWNCKIVVPPGLVSPAQRGACKIPS